jgi:hypothetical protein
MKEFFISCISKSRKSKAGTKVLSNKYYRKASPAKAQPNRP